jgi:dolichol-phosphate mannosyltransferase
VARELLVVVPVYNEEQCIDLVLREWIEELDRSGIDYGLLLLDDGSTDRTPAIIAQWLEGRANSHLEVVRQTNRGHGQTCLEGYRVACDRKIPWVLQIDSDGQCDPAYFLAVWAKRNERDVVYGHRAERRDGWKRRLSSALVRLVVRVASGASCVDANVPYRLMSTTKLLSLVNSIPAQFHLANIALAVQMKRAGRRETSVPIVFRPRAGGDPSVPLVRFAGKALELFGQLLLLPRPVLCDAA